MQKLPTLKETSKTASDPKYDVTSSLEDDKNIIIEGIKETMSQIYLGKTEESSIQIRPPVQCEVVMTADLGTVVFHEVSWLQRIEQAIAEGGTLVQPYVECFIETPVVHTSRIGGNYRENIQSVEPMEMKLKIMANSSCLDGKNEEVLDLRESFEKISRLKHGTAEDVVVKCGKATRVKLSMGCEEREQPAESIGSKNKEAKTVSSCENIPDGSRVKRIDQEDSTGVRLEDLACGDSKSAGITRKTENENLPNGDSFCKPD